MKKYIYIVGFSEFASRMNFMAMTSLLIISDHVEWYLTGFFLARQVGGIVTSVLAARWADNFNRKKMMIWSDVISAFAVLLPLLFEHPVAIWFAAFILGCTYQTFYISYSASIPDFFGSDKAPNINSLITQISSLVSIIGFLLGGFFTEHFSAKPVIIFDSVTYLLSGVALVFLNRNWLGDAYENDQFDEGGLGCKVNQQRIILPFSVMALFYSLAISGYNYALPLLATSFQYESLANGVLWTAASAGAFLGAWYGRKSSQFVPYLIGLAMMAVFISVTFLFEQFIWIMIFLFVSGLFDGFSQVLGNTILQKVPLEQRGKAFGMQGLCMRIGFLLGFLLCPFFVTSFTLVVNVWIFQGGLLVACLVTYFYGKDRFA